MLQKKSRLFRMVMIPLMVIGVLLVVFSSALALNAFLKTWQDTYPHSTSDAASCDLCHGTSTSNLNAYGQDLCEAFNGSVPADSKAALLAIEGLDSDGNGDSNLVEIDAGAQPGWTTGPVNQIYDTNVAAGCEPIGAPIEPLSTLPLPLDPPIEGEPVAIPGGPYTGNVNVPVTFDGSDSYDSDGGPIASYAWDFGDGSTGSGAVVQHAYAAAGTYIVSLTVVDNDDNSNTATTTATISGDAVLDLDIASFAVSSSVRVGKSISVKMAVDNPGPILGQALATVEGWQNGSQVYIWSLNVYDMPGGKTTNFSFPSYKPAAAGTIDWTVTIFDADPDSDIATAATTVK